jgi:cytochrome b
MRVTGVITIMNSRDIAQSVPAWDLFVRVFHWSLVACVLIDYFVVDDGKALHQWLGYVAAGLVVARVVWGFVGSEHARFADFFPTPARLRAHIQALQSRQPDSHAGHNPFGAVMMLALMALVLLVCLSGYLEITDTFWGEEWVQDTHEVLSELLIGLVGLHALAAIVMSHLDRTNLVAAMITGVKVRRDGGLSK